MAKGKVIQTEQHTGTNGRIEYARTKDCPGRCWQVNEHGMVVEVCQCYEIDLGEERCTETCQD